MKQKVFSIKSGPLILKRFPEYSDDSLRAWDAADEYIINYFSDNFGLQNNKTVLILNDSFGALTVSFNKSNHNVYTHNDSLIAEQAIKRNCDLNKVKYNFADLDNILEIIDFVIIKIPKDLKYFEYQLDKINNKLSGETIVIAAFMQKYFSKNIYKILEDKIGNITSLPGVKKAKLLLAENTNVFTPHINDYIYKYKVSWLEKELVNYPGVFSSKKIDNGTSFFIDKLKLPDGEIEVADFGCGNGIISIYAAIKNKDARITAIDESFSAIKSALENIKRNRLEKRIEIINDFSINNLNKKFDVILSNPPFHSGNSISREAAEELISVSFDKLKKGGFIQIVANKTLGYHSLLNKRFSNCTVVAESNKYSILKSIKR